MVSVSRSEVRVLHPVSWMTQIARKMNCTLSCRRKRRCISIEGVGVKKWRQSQLHARSQRGTAGTGYLQAMMPVS
jgi:hypothetical protein